MHEDKYAAESGFWARELGAYVRWYQGVVQSMYFRPSPLAEEQVRRHDVTEKCALDTWTCQDCDRYLKHLMLDRLFFENQSVLDVGCGPLGLARAFWGAAIIGVDPLISVYRKAGYPIHSQGVHYLERCIENLEKVFSENSFDAAISVNAIDHVDDFELAIQQIERAVRPDGVIRIEAHYHKATETEPLELNDDRVSGAFRKFRVEKISDVPFQKFYPGHSSPDERLTLWSNVSYLHCPYEIP